MNKIRVLYILNSSYPGGATTAFVNLLDSIKSHIEPYIIVPAGQNRYAIDILKEKGYSVCGLNLIENIYPRSLKIRPIYRFLRDYYRSFKSRKIVEQIASEFKPDIIHTNSGVMTIGYKLAKKHGIPHVWHLREYLDIDFGLHPIPSWRSHMKKYRDAQHNHCITITKNVTKHFGLTDNYTQIYDGVIPDVESKRCKKDNYFLFVGRLEDAKGIKSLLTAYIKYSLEKGTTPLYVAGQGTPAYVDQCKALLEGTPAKGNVKFLGHCDDVYSLMSKAKVLFVTSRFEGFGFITAEAMYNYCLVVGRNTGGTKEQFDNGLSLTDKEIGIRYTSDSQLSGIMHEIDQNTYDEILEAAHHTVMQLYTHSQHSSSVLKLYKALLHVK